MRPSSLRNLESERGCTVCSALRQRRQPEASQRQLHQQEIAATVMNVGPLRLSRGILGGERMYNTRRGRSADAVTATPPPPSDGADAALPSPPPT
ncbi:unnamed protein product [Lampetra fluviatilis]